MTVFYNPKYDIPHWTLVQLVDYVEVTSRFFWLGDVIFPSVWKKSVFKIGQTGNTDFIYGYKALHIPFFTYM